MIQAKQLSWLTYGLSLSIGLGAAVSIFGWPVLLGLAPYWDSPRGIVGNSGLDMLQALSGYDLFVRDIWRWPLLRVEGLGGPQGTIIAFTDSAPALVIIGRMIFRLTGATPVLFGFWTAGCFILSAVASTALVRLLGGRSVVAGVTAAVVAVSMPALLVRWGHLTLMAQGLIPLTLFAYLNLTRGVRPNRAFAAMLLICLFSTLTSPYLFFMVISIALAGAAQSGLNRVVSPLRAVLHGACLIGGCLVMLFTLGYLSADSFADWGFGTFSMNLLSPIVPQVSGLYPGARGLLDATGGQYEGLVYLGMGLLLMTVIAMPDLRRHLPGRIGRHKVLAIVLLGSLALAISNEVYAGPIHLMSVPLPDFLDRLTGTVRASGRLAWIALYLGTGLVISTVARLRWAAPVLIIACVLQWVDAGPLRSFIRASVAVPFNTIDRAAWANALPMVRQVIVSPPFLCIIAKPENNGIRLAAVEIQLKAAQAGIPNNSVYAARTRPDCSLPEPRPGALLVFLQPEAIRPDMPCASGALLTVCHDRLSTATLAALATTTPIPENVGE